MSPSTIRISATLSSNVPKAFQNVSCRDFGQLNNREKTGPLPRCIQDHLQRPFHVVTPNSRLLSVLPMPAAVCHWAAATLLHAGAYSRHDHQLRPSLATTGTFSMRRQSSMPHVLCAKAHFEVKGPMSRDMLG